MEGLLDRLGENIVDANEGAPHLFFQTKTHLP
jgi:hypothetical protein